MSCYENALSARLARAICHREEQRVPDQKEEEREKDTKPTTWWVVPDVYEKSLTRKKRRVMFPLLHWLGTIIKTAFRNAFIKKSIKVPEDLIEVVQRIETTRLIGLRKGRKKASAVVETALEDDHIIEQTREAKGLSKQHPGVEC